MNPCRIALIMALAGALVVACGDSGNNRPDGGNGMDGCQGAGEKLLSVVGNPNRIMHPGQQTDLSVVLLEKCVGAVSGETVTFTILQNPGLASLSSNSAVTAPTGLAQVTLNIAPTEILGDKLFQVHATHPADPEGVYFSITIKPAVTQLFIYGVDSLECFVGESLELKVQAKDGYSGAPARGVEIKFSIDKPPAGANAALPVPVVATNASGVATTLFQCGTMATQYTVVAEGNSSNLGLVTFSIKVKNRKACVKDSDCDPGFKCISGQCRQSGGQSCATDDDCPAGFECIGLQCVPEGSLPTSCNSSADCPAGYYCQGHECFPCPEVSNIPECQQGGDQCRDDKDCPPGFICQNGVCVPQNPQGVDIPELGGKWYTRHFFDTSRALGGASVAGIIDRLNRAINYCDITGIGMIDKLLCNFIKQYIPAWAGTLIDIFANLINMLKELRAEGVMQVTHLNPRELISATERWDTLLVRYLNACCIGQPPGCNPYQRPNFPDCATIDITRNQLQVGKVGIEVQPFTGKIQVDSSANPPRYTLMVDPRVVKVEYSKFVGFLIDLLVQMFLGYRNLEDALTRLIDCAAIGRSAKEFCEDLGLGWIMNCTNVGNSARQTCTTMLPRAADLIKGLLDQIGVGWKMLRFSGPASIKVQGAPPYGIMLGTPDFETTKDGRWTGKVQIILDADMEGAWKAER